jgi:hypothetical protein
MVNDEGELLAFRVTTAEVNDQMPVGRMATHVQGVLSNLCEFSDRVLCPTLSRVTAQFLE